MYETVDHTGDVALRLVAPSLAELVAEGIHGLCGILFDGRPAEAAPRERLEVRVSGVDPEDTLVRALSEALYWMQSESRFPLDVRVLEAGDGLDLRIEGTPADGRLCRRVDEIKAVTYHQLQIRETPEGLTTVVVLDV